MTGPLAPLFAQVREGMVYRRGGESTCVPLYPNCTCPDCLALRALSAIERHVQDMEKALARAVYLGEHLHQMIPREVWRDHGAEWMGQYEGDYHAEQVRDELAALAALPAREKGEE